MPSAASPKRALVLFDIDGTLVQPNGAGSRALLAAGSALFGDAFEFEGFDPSGKLDLDIFEEIADRNPELDVRGRASELMRLYVEKLQGEAHRMRALPGASATVARVAQEPGVAVGILTGNHTVVARMKLEVTGLVPSGGPGPFLVRACGDEAASRPELVSLARSRYLAASGVAPEGLADEALALVLVGDSPRDVEAGHAHGAPVVGVATGRWGAADLAAAGADRVVPDLRDPEPLLEIVRQALHPA